jgi:hypothetical protein
MGGRSALSPWSRAGKNLPLPTPSVLSAPTSLQLWDSFWYLENSTFQIGLLLASVNITLQPLVIRTVTSRVTPVNASD